MPSAIPHLLEDEIHIGQQRQVAAARDLPVPASTAGDPVDVWTSGLRKCGEMVEIEIEMGSKDLKSNEIDI